MIPFINVKCHNCNTAYINGVLCHEHGCPTAFRVPMNCKDCDTKFMPATKWQKYCQDCIDAASYSDRADLA